MYMRCSSLPTTFLTLLSCAFCCLLQACYPYMERSAKVNAAAYLGAALSGAVLLASSTGEAVTRSSAYLPLPLAVAISDGVAAMALAVVFAVGVPCLLSLL